VVKFVRSNSVKMGNNSAKLQPLVMEDLLNNTSFTEKELQKWYRDFIKDFPSGTLSIEQFKEVYAQNFPEGDASRFAEHVFRSLDTDGDKELDFREFITALSVTGRGGPVDRLKWAFRVYDVNDDGEISQEECTSIIRVSGRENRVGN
jgi:Ca2+-binding EF-hand superfamily protein